MVRLSALRGLSEADKGVVERGLKLAESLRSRGLPVHTTREPSDGPIGMLLRQILTGRVVVPGLSGARPPSWSTMALLFAADRLDHVEAEIRPNLMDGVTVITDRYDHSSIAYQSITGGGTAETVAWVKTLNAEARRPDLTIVLDIPADVAARRRLERAHGRELYDDDELQSQLTGFYEEMDGHFPDDAIVHVDADREREEVAKDVMRHVRILRGEDPED